MISRPPRSTLMTHSFPTRRSSDLNYTELLCAVEGITSYYDDLALLRSGVIDVASYLELLGQSLTRVARGHGRFKQTVTESSFDAWTKFYKQDESAANVLVSYYTQGAWIALALDLTLRDRQSVVMGKRGSVRVDL